GGGCRNFTGNGALACPLDAQKPVAASAAKNSRRFNKSHHTRKSRAAGPITNERVLKRFRECTRSLTLAAQYPLRNQCGCYRAATVRERFRQKSRKRLSTPNEPANRQRTG